jgi:hypothetical protein
MAMPRTMVDSEPAATTTRGAVILLGNMRLGSEVLRKVVWKVLGKLNSIGTSSVLLWNNRFLPSRPSSSSCCILLRDFSSSGKSEWSGYFGVCRARYALYFSCVIGHQPYVASTMRTNGNAQ